MAYLGPVSRAKRAPVVSSGARAVARAAPRIPARSTTIRSLAGIDDAGTNTDAKIFAAGLVAGLAVGAGAALLLAPQSGEDVRHALRREFRRVRRRGSDAWDDLRDELRQAHARRRRRTARDEDDDDPEV